LGGGAWGGEGDVGFRGKRGGREPGNVFREGGPQKWGGAGLSPGAAEDGPKRNSARSKADRRGLWAKISEQKGNAGNPEHT